MEMPAFDNSGIDAGEVNLSKTKKIRIVISYHMHYFSTFVKDLTKWFD
jgi:hypothetical protein